MDRSYGQADHFDCAGIREPKYILMLPHGGALIVKERFGNTVTLDRCLVQTRYALTLTKEDESRNYRVACREIRFKDGSVILLFLCSDLQKSFFP